ncbi:hypothetical protein AOLI_G00057320 [Acnodon oligacanthus]
MEILLWLCLSHVWVCRVLSSPVRCQINQAQLQDVEHLSGSTDTHLLDKGCNDRKTSVIEEVLAALLSLGSISDSMEAQRAYLETEGLIPSSGKNDSGKVSPPAKASEAIPWQPGCGEGSSGEVSSPTKASEAAASQLGSKERSGEVSPPAEAGMSQTESEKASPREVSAPAEATALQPGSERGSSGEKLVKPQHRSLDPRMVLEK